MTVRILNGLCSQKKNMLYARDKKSYKRAKSMENAIERNIHYASKNDISITEAGRIAIHDYLNTDTGRTKPNKTFCTLFRFYYV